jgi:hypothetical protein
VVGVVEADREELAGARDGRLEANVGERDAPVLRRERAGRGIARASPAVRRPIMSRGNAGAAAARSTTASPSTAPARVEPDA